MSKKSLLVILDADVIITCHREGIWDHINSHYSVQIPETVAVEEAKYFTSADTGRKYDIDLMAQVDANEVELIYATSEEIENLRLKASKSFFRAIDPGETEAIAILFSRQASGPKFCTGDQTAIRAASALGLGHSLVSLQKLCKDAKITADLSPNFSERTCQDKIVAGMQNRDFFLRQDD